jgi:hypothetical protein
MSYCRWSDDRGRCDLYAYADVMGGYTVHVADRRPRYRGEFPPAPSMRDNLWIEWWHECRDLSMSEGMEPIGGPHDGETIRVDTLDDLRSVLNELRNAGYRFPDDVLERVEAEISEEH